MLCATERAREREETIHQPMLLRFPPRTFPFLHHHSHRLSPPSTFFISRSSPSKSRRMSTVRSSSVVEHIVLFDVKSETAPEKVESMLSGLRSLSSLDSVLFLTAGPVAGLRSSSFSFTHLLHGRYRTKQSLADYSAHPSHVAVVRDSILPIVRDIMAVDWVADLDAAAPPVASAAFRLTLVKPRPDLDGESLATIGKVLEGIKSSVPSAIEVSFGENFSPARAKGFEWGLISFFPGMEDLSAVDSDEELARAQKEKVKDFVDGVIVVDYELPKVQPPPLPTSL